MKKFPTICFLATAAMFAHDVSAKDTGLKLKYDRPAEFFEEALPIGNGRIGAMVYGGVGRDVLSLNDITLWTGEPANNAAPADAHKTLAAVREALVNDDYRLADSLQRGLQGSYTNNYQPLGTLAIEFDDAVMQGNYNRELDIVDAVATTRYMADGYKVTRRYYASAPDSVIVVVVETENPAGISATVILDSQLPHKLHTDGNSIVSDGYVAYSSMPSYCPGAAEKIMYDDERGMRFSTIASVESKGGKVFPAGDDRMRVEGAKYFIVKVVNGTSFNGYDKNAATDGMDCRVDARRRSERVALMSHNKLFRRHVEDFNKVMNRVSLDLGKTDDAIAALTTDEQLKQYTDGKQHNPDLEELYFQYGRYLLASSSRTPGVPANLQGLWNEQLLPPWSCNYTININLEENYWPANVANMSEFELPLIDFVNNISKNGEEVAANYYGADGWCAGHNSDIWAMANPVGGGGGDPVWANWTMGGAWLATHIYNHYLFNPDREFLEKNYPVLRGAAEFCLSWLVERDGELVTAPGTSPENVYITDSGYRGATLYGSTADLAFVRQCLMDTRDAARVLGVDAELASRIDSTLEKLHPYKVGHKGNLQEWYHDWADAEPTHRHQSHLFGVFPGNHITPEGNPELCKAASRTLELKGDDTTGWSTGWRINIFARLGEAESAYRMYRRLLKFVTPDKYRGPDVRRGGGTYPNLFDAHSPFQIDGNFGGTAGVAEMLLQSTPDCIILLPALPEAWSSGSVKGLKARGGYIVDIDWKDGKVTSCKIASQRGGKTTVRYNGEEKSVDLKPGKSVKLN